MASKPLRAFRGDLRKSWRSPGDRLLSAATGSFCEVTADKDGRPMLSFGIFGAITGDIDSIIARLEGIRTKGERKAGA